MTGHLSHDANLARLEDMRTRAAARRSATRHATGADRVAVERLAALDSAEAPSGELLIAEVGDEPQAAIEIATGATIADPFRSTADLVELLSLRATWLRQGTEFPRHVRLRPWSPRALRERQRMPSSP